MFGQALVTQKDYIEARHSHHSNDRLAYCMLVRQVLQQRHAKVESERNQLYSKFEASIYSVQQKTGVRNLLLEKKLSALSSVVEHKEAQLAEVMAASNLDPATLAQLNTVSPRLPSVSPWLLRCIRVLKAFSSRFG